MLICFMGTVFSSNYPRAFFFYYCKDAKGDNIPLVEMKSRGFHDSRLVKNAVSRSVSLLESNRTFAFLARAKVKSAHSCQS